ncbi:hypothetical protein [Paraburkholderia sp. D1E]|uniref:hypothetical protein n=1 Tax=Paraburkholderia sp. D1E TaxID=3461398 RepID=UPI0040465B5F
MGRAMVQPEDNRTIPLPLPVVTEKRGRGRPRKDGALTNAQRQAAYRARHKTQGEAVTVTKKIPPVADGYDELVIENERLREEVAALRAASVSGGGRDSLPVVLAVREPIPEDRRQGEYRLGVSVADAARCALERLASDVGVSKGVVVERLLYWADEAVLRSLVNDDAFNRYLARKRNGKSGV